MSCIFLGRPTVRKAENADQGMRFDVPLEEGEVREYCEDKVPLKVNQNVQSMFKCTFNGCQELFKRSKIFKKQLLTHYLGSHQESRLLYYLVEALMPGKIPNDVEEIKLNMKNGNYEHRFLCIKSSCLATFRTQEALDEHKRLCYATSLDILQEKCKHCNGIFKFCQEHITNECVHVNELLRIRGLIT